MLGADGWDWRGHGHDLSCCYGREDLAGDWKSLSQICFVSHLFSLIPASTECWRGVCLPLGFEGDDVSRNEAQFMEPGPALLKPLPWTGRVSTYQPGSSCKLDYNGTSLFSHCNHLNLHPAFAQSHKACHVGPRRRLPYCRRRARG